MCAKEEDARLPELLHTAKRRISATRRMCETARSAHLSERDEPDYDLGDHCRVDNDLEDIESEGWTVGCCREEHGHETAGSAPSVRPVGYQCQHSQTVTHERMAMLR